MLTSYCSATANPAVLRGNNNKLSSIKAYFNPGVGNIETNCKTARRENEFRILLVPVLVCCRIPCRRRWQEEQTAVLRTQAEIRGSVKQRDFGHPRRRVQPQGSPGGCPAMVLMLVSLIPAKAGTGEIRASIDSHLRVNDVRKVFSDELRVCISEVLKF